MTRWVRFYECSLHDPKVLRLSDFDYRRWTQLLLVAGKHEGRLPGIEDVALELRLDENAVRSLIERLANAGLIDRSKGGVCSPHNWDKFQYKSDTSTDRVKRFRERFRNVSVTPPDTDTDTDQKEAQTSSSPLPPDTATNVSVSPPKGATVIDFPKDEKPKKRRSVAGLSERDLDLFETAWAKYPRDGKTSKAKALERFARLSNWDREDFNWGVQLYVDHLAKERERWPDKRPCDCVVFINQRRWEPLMEAAGITPLAQDQTA